MESSNSSTKSQTMPSTTAAPEQAPPKPAATPAAHSPALVWIHEFVLYARMVDPNVSCQEQCVGKRHVSVAREWTAEPWQSRDTAHVVPLLLPTTVQNEQTLGPGHRLEQWNAGDTSADGTGDPIGVTVAIHDALHQLLLRFVCVVSGGYTLSLVVPGKGSESKRRPSQTQLLKRTTSVRYTCLVPPPPSPAAGLPPFVLRPTQCSV
ncbi:unnamed protein product [Notodromas monacha]|uniref:Uncharacterized protein n=1 Tax=Notodromas monacha TaxID=399045 RepID=A0A7R9BU42_9CRUS|nr:unnamed protein product [Notodromas monacha]CAG0920160.1 unnamed protein product [Notodromas monacha]